MNETIDTSQHILSDAERFAYLQAMEVPVWIPRDWEEKNFHQAPQTNLTFPDSQTTTNQRMTTPQTFDKAISDSTCDTTSVKTGSTELASRSEKQAIVARSELNTKIPSENTHYIKLVPWNDLSNGEQSILIICRHQTDQPAQSFAKANRPSQFMQDYVLALKEFYPQEKEIQIRLGHLSQAGLGRDCRLMEDVLTGVKPDKILLLGDEAVKELLTEYNDVAQARGQVHQLANGIECLVSYHPYTLIMNPALKRLALEDLKLFSRLVSKGE
ncbi:hypothetical protein [Aliikangiella sp. IMCC44359]|uniref:hypothetical protein n=1 Tax=Aliikangiella sp. IMCC44359 TaxID=3459125 RepID=UPI00403AD8B2